MKYQKKITICFMLSFLLSSCFGYIHIFSVKKMRYEQNYNSYLSSLKIDTSQSFQIKETYDDSMSMLPYALDTYKLARGGKASVAEFRMYDSTGKFMTGYAQCWGPVKHFGILDSFPYKEVNWLPMNKELTFQKDVNLFAPNDQIKQQLLDSTKTKRITIVVLYVEWVGWYSENMLKNLGKYLDKYGRENFNVIYVNNTTPSLDKVTEKSDSL